MVNFANKLLDVIDRAVSQPATASLPPLPSGGSSADLKSAMTARSAAVRKSGMLPAEFEAGLNAMARHAAKKLGLDVPFSTQPSNRPSAHSPLFYAPWPHVHLKAAALAGFAAEQGVELLTAKELEALRDVVKRADDVEKIQLASTPTIGYNVDAYLEAHNKLSSTPGWISLDRESAKLSMRSANKIREVEKRRIFAEAVPILEKVGERLTTVLQQKLIAQLEIELQFAHQNGVPFSPSVLLASVDMMLGRMKEYRDYVRLDGAVPGQAFGGLINLLLQ